MDGDGRGGAALSMRAVTGKPIKFVGLGEKLDALEEFHPDRIAGRILGMGDIVALVEKAQETIEAEQAERMVKRFQKGQFNMNDLKSQLQQMQKMGGMSGVMGLMPGMAKMSKQMDEAGLDDRMLRRQIALINSMTKKERRSPELLQASAARSGIAAGAGLEVQELNRLLKMHRQMADVMKKMGGMGKKGLLRGGLGALFGKGAGRRCRRARPVDAGAGRAAARHGAAARPLRARPQEMTAIPVLATERLMLRAPAAGRLRALCRLLRLRAQRLGGRADDPRAAAWAEFAAAAGGWVLRGLRPVLGRGARGWRLPRRGRPLPAAALSRARDRLDPDGRGRGPRRRRAEAARAVRAWAYATLGLATMVSYIAPGNWRSIRLAERLGAVADPGARSCGPDAGVWRHPGPEALA